MKKLQLITGLLIIIACQENGFADTPFEGVRAGIQVGYGLLDSKLKTSVAAGTATDSSDVSGRGAVGGVTIDWASMVGHSNTLMGLEASFNWITSKGKKSIVGTFYTGGNDDLTTTIQLRRSYDVSAKLGHVFQGAAMAYLKAGASLAHLKASSVSNSIPASGASSGNVVGLVIGLGAEFPITEERVTWGIEYNYRNYSAFSYVFNTNSGVPILNVGVTPSSHAIMLRLNYKMSAVEFTTSAPKKERKRKRVRKTNAG